jgi:hypothetical protein
MGALHDVWLKNQMQLPDERLMLKSAEGYRPITKRQLLALIAGAEPGDQFTLNGLTISIGEGDTVQITSTSQPDFSNQSDDNLTKSASRGRGSAPTFGDCLLYQFRQNERKNSF